MVPGYLWLAIRQKYTFVLSNFVLSNFWGLGDPNILAKEAENSDYRSSPGQKCPYTEFFVAKDLDTFWYIPLQSL